MRTNPLILPKANPATEHDPPQKKRSGAPKPHNDRQLDTETLAQSEEWKWQLSMFASHITNLGFHNAVTRNIMTYI